MGGLLQGPAYNYYDDKVMEELVGSLNGTQLIAQGENIPVGIETITKDKLKELKGEAARGRAGQPIPREMGELEPHVVYMLNIAHGFYVHEDKITASQRFGTPLPDTGARQSARLVSKDINDLIFNGDAGYKTKGMLDTTKIITVASGSEWNSTSGGNPYAIINKASAILSQNGLFSMKKIGLKPTAYDAMFNLVPNTSVTHAELIAKRLPNGLNDIIKIPIGLPADTDGVVCDFGPQIAERYVIRDPTLQERATNEDGNIPFNVISDQGMMIKELDAFIKLKNLIDPTKIATG